MAENRMNKIDGEIQKVLSNVLLYELKNPIFENKFISVTKVNTTPDLKYSKVFLSIFPENDKEKVFNEIRNCTPYIRRTIAKKINLRVCPEFTFVIDDTLEYANKMDKLFEQIKKSEDKND